jgi:hypothetical protein
VPQGAGPDWLAAFAARLGRTQTEAASKAAAWATQYVRELAALQPAAPPPAAAQQQTDKYLYAPHRHAKTLAKQAYSALRGANENG